jgi:hypothetical protein
MTGPLHGVRVLDLTRLLPGGFATMALADRCSGGASDRSPATCAATTVGRFSSTWLPVPTC